MMCVYIYEKIFDLLGKILFIYEEWGCNVSLSVGRLIFRHKTDAPFPVIK